MNISLNVNFYRYFINFFFIRYLFLRLLLYVYL
nr:MAG TPA: hypothetical protein [Caudoviricetes sp.]DAS44943.1 MAG TPA: hypothetical protein [Caudoviricetes sp.]